MFLRFVSYLATRSNLFSYASLYTMELGRITFGFAVSEVTFESRCLLQLNDIIDSRKPSPLFKKAESMTKSKFCREMKILQCSECNKTFTTKLGFDKHVQHHTEQYSFFCSICRKGFNNGYNFKEHMRGHEGRGYPCEYCGKVFKSKKYMKYHESEHTGKYRFECGRVW